MNLFILHHNPTTAAQMNCDKHVCKIILESLQLMSLAHLENGSTEPNLWNAHTHRNNHVSRWVRETLQNYTWTSTHALALCAEYTKRYHKTHKCEQLIQWCATHHPPLPTTGLTPFRQAVAEDCYHHNPITAYRTYYVRYKRPIAKWKLGNTPNWYLQMCNIEDRHRKSDTPPISRIRP